MEPNHRGAGDKIGEIGVAISHKIISLFSEGLYSSPNKAVEELVCNSFDAGAENVHVLISPNLKDDSATIVVIDDGEGMGESDLEQHWRIGHSTRRARPVKERTPIGKFGIGKLATYVLANELTHITKHGDRYLAVTMDYSRIGRIEESAIMDGQTLMLDLRELSADEAKAALAPWTTGSGSGFDSVCLFGSDGAETWTVAVLSNLKPPGRKISKGRLRWILRTAMPLRDDFNLYLDGLRIESSKVNLPRLGPWVIGRDLGTDGTPIPGFDGGELEAVEDVRLEVESPHRFGVTSPILGRVTGLLEVFKADLSTGKAADTERSHGFFVYVRGRLINGLDDAGFGIERNVLRHGTFNKVRVILHVDSLDDELRSSREQIREGALCEEARRLLRGIFNFARSKLQEDEIATSPAARIAERLRSTPGSLTRAPMASLAHRVVRGDAHPLLSRLSTDLPTAKELDSAIDELRSGDRPLLRRTDLPEHGASDMMVSLDVTSGTLELNAAHPFVAAFYESFSSRRYSMPLEMLILTDVLLEAHLYKLGIEESQIQTIVRIRDEILRELVRHSGRRSALSVSQALVDARDNQDGLEEEMRAAFEIMGFDNVIRLGGRSKPDGTADAILPATPELKKQRYRVGLEAKSGGVVTAKRLGVSDLIRHMERFACDHHLVIGNSFQTSQDGPGSATLKNIENGLRGLDRTITLMHVEDFATLVRLVPLKQIGLTRIQTLFTSCRSPEESHEWLAEVSVEAVDRPPFKEILDAIWTLSKKNVTEPVWYTELRNELRHVNPPIDMQVAEVGKLCAALQGMTPLVRARPDTVEVDRRPDMVLDDIESAIAHYPKEERETLWLSE